MKTAKIPWSLVVNTVKRRHCIAAMEQIDRENMPDNRNWTKYYIYFKNANNTYKHYSPKYVIELAFNIASKESNQLLTLTSNDFSESLPVKAFLDSLRFDVFLVKKK